MYTTVKILSGTAFAVAAALATAHAADGTWSVDSNGLWSAAGNWSGEVIADGDTSTANFTHNITADRTVSLDSARTLNKLVFSDSVTSTPGSWLIDNDSNAANILTLAGTAPSITAHPLGTGKTAEISAVIAGSTQRITKAGTGTLILSGANTYTVGMFLSGGVVIMNNADAAVGGSNSGTFANGSSLEVENSAFRQSAGKITITDSTVATANGVNTFVTGGNYKYGAYELSGGILEINNPWRMNPRRSQITQTGGEIDISYTGTGAIRSGREFFIGNAGERAVVYATAGTTTITTASTLTGAALVISDTNNGTSGTAWNVNGSELTIAGTADWTVSGGAGFVHMTRGSSGDNDRETGNLNLNSGGRLTTRGIAQGDTNPGAIGRLNFNGGTLRAGSDNSTFLQGITTARIYSGGATIDTDDKNITIGQPLLAPTGTGVTSVAISSGGSNYFGAPIVTITGGGGTGATAVASFDANTRAVTGVIITCPGSGYTNTPTVAINHGRQGGGNPTLGTITLAALTGGGLTKIGTGTLTLTGANSYSGATVVSNGTLRIDGDSSGATGTLTVESGALLGGSGSYGGSITLNAGAALNCELNLTDSTLACGGQLSFTDLDFADCIFAFAPGAGYPPRRSFTLIEAASLGTATFANARGEIDSVPARLSVSGNNLMLSVGYSGTVITIL